MALDLDGTTLGPDHKLPEETRSAIATAQSRGVKVVLVTGRMYQSARRYAAELNLEGLPMATYNGGAIWEYPSDRLLFHAPLSLEAGKKVAAFCEARGLHLNAYVDDQLYVRDMGEKTQEYVAIAGVKAHPVGSIFLWLDRPSTKMLIVDEPDVIVRIRGELGELLGPGYHLTSSTPRFLEITSDRATKGLALEWIAGSLGIPREQVMAVGDAFNDLPMLRWAGTSFAMAHAPEAVRAATTHIAEGGPGLGVVDALRQMGLA